MDGLTLVDCVCAKFSGDRGGEGPVTLGQLNTAEWIGDQTRDYFGVSELVLSLPAGVSVEDIVDTFATLMSLHESLRTSFALDGEPRQRVARAGELPIDIYQLSDEAVDPSIDTDVPYAIKDLDPRNTANPAFDLLARLRAKPFNVTDDLLVRAAIAVRDGVPRASAIVCSHLVADVGAMMVIGRQFTQLAANRDGRQARVDTRARQPLDQAAFERTERGRAQAAATLRFWENNLRWMPQCTFATPAARAALGRPLSGWLHSPALAMALPHIAARTGASPPMALTAALSAVVSRRTGHPRIVLRSISSNRIGKQLRDYVGTIAQDSLLAVDARTASFDDLVRRCGVASIWAGRYGLFPNSRLVEVAHQAEHERGVRFHRDGVLNNLGLFTVSKEGPDWQAATADGRAPTTPADVAAALAGTNIAWWEPSIFNDVLAEFQVVQTDHWISLGLWTCDRGRMPRDEIEMLLHGVDRLIAAAAAGDVDLDRLDEVAGVSPLHRGPEWCLVDSCWVELPEVQRLLDDVHDGPAARVFADPVEGSDRADTARLVAYLVPGERVRGPEQAHAACVAALGGRFTAMAPGRYVFCDRAPDDPGDLAAWRRQRVLVDSDGRRWPPVTAVGEG